MWVALQKLVFLIMEADLVTTLSTVQAKVRELLTITIYVMLCSNKQWQLALVLARRKELSCLATTTSLQTSSSLTSQEDVMQPMMSPSSSL